MNKLLAFAIETWLRIFFIFTPFLVLSIFLGITKDYQAARRRAFALRSISAVAAICFVVYFFGTAIFSLFGITLDSFRIGAGALLFINAVNLVQGRMPTPTAGEDDSAVVPFAMPIIVGPAVIGVLFVLGAEVSSVEQRIIGLGAVGLAIGCLGGLLLAATRLEQIIGNAQLRIISKITGLILAAMSAQMIFAGIKNIIRD